MSRKQSTVQRIRKKASGLSRSNTDGSSDPYHNGETPSCRLLVEAVQDIFPELYPERQKKVESSELGQLLRWQVLKRRQERVFPPALPLTSSEEVKDSEDIVDTSPTVTGKKKKKKKKKKKENEYVESSSNIAAIPDESRATQGLLSGTVIEPDMRNGGLPLFEFGGEEVDEEEAEIASLNDGRPGKPKFRPSLDALDRSLHEMEEERSRYEDEATPDLLDLPSDALMRFPWRTRNVMKIIMMKYQSQCPLNRLLLHRDIHHNEYGHRRQSRWILSMVFLPIPRRNWETATTTPTGIHHSPLQTMNGSPRRMPRQRQRHHLEMQSRIHLVCRIYFL